MRKWVVPVLAALAAVAVALPAGPVDRVKRADETVMFGNQQNLAHKSVKKSGPAPLGSKMAAKREQVVEHQQRRPAPEDDPVRELDGVAKPADAEKALHQLASHGPAEPNAPLIAEESKADRVKPQEKKRVDPNMGEKPKRQAKGLEDKARKEYEDDLQARYLYILNKLEPAFAFANGASQRRRKRAAGPAAAALTPGKLQRLRRDLTSLASESHMAASAQHRKKRDIDYDPRSLAMLEYMLSAANDGYDAPEEVVEPSYEADPAELEAQEAAEEPEMEARARRDLMDDYSNYAIAKRAPDYDEAAPEELVEAPESPEEEEAAAEEEPASVYESEYGPVTYGLIQHEGVDGLFVPLEQPSMRRLLAAEKEDREAERARLRTLATLLSLNQEKRK